MPQLEISHGRHDNTGRACLIYRCVSLLDDISTAAAVVVIVVVVIIKTKTMT